MRRITQHAPAQLQGLERVRIEARPDFGHALATATNSAEPRRPHGHDEALEITDRFIEPISEIVMSQAGLRREKIAAVGSPPKRHSRIWMEHCQSGSSEVEEIDRADLLF